MACLCASTTGLQPPLLLPPFSSSPRTFGLATMAWPPPRLPGSRLCLRWAKGGHRSSAPNVPSPVLSHSAPILICLASEAAMILGHVALSAMRLARRGSKSAPCLDAPNGHESSDSSIDLWWRQCASRACSPDATFAPGCEWSCPRGPSWAKSRADDADTAALVDELADTDAFASSSSSRVMTDYLAVAIASWLRGSWVIVLCS